MLSHSARSVSRNTLLPAALLILGACSESVVLGTECPESRGPCHGGAAPDDAASPVSETGPTDAGLTSDDAARDAGPETGTGVELLRIENGSFELRANGAFATLEAQFEQDVFVGGLGSTVPVAGGIFANLEPWFACFIGTKSVSQLQNGMYQATDGKGFVSANGGLTGLSPGLYQALATPLQAGRSYSFEIDLLSSSDGANDVALQIGADAQGCGSLKGSSKTPNLHDADGWKTYCLTLTPGESLAVLGLVPLNLGASSGLAFDNLRSVASCP